MIDFRPIERQVLTAAEAAQYLALDSPRALERLVQSKRLTPLRLGKSNAYARSELDELVRRELLNERRMRGTNNGEGS